MRINLNHYLIGKAFIQSWFLNNSKDDPEHAISFLACVTFTPIVVVAFYVGEISGWSKETLDVIDRLIKFYNYKYIEGIPESFPKKLDF